MEVASAIDFYVLTEGCISFILSLTSPRDACRSAAVSSVFRSASESDLVWERFLPSDCLDIISKSASPSTVTLSSKKQLYFWLCDTPLLVDGGNKSFGLEKWSGKKCYMLGARELGIVWGDTPRYWKWTSLPDSRFAEVAELERVCWLEIRCKMDTSKLSPKTNYAAYFVFKTGSGAYGLSFLPAEVSVRSIGGGGSGEPRKVFLDAEGNDGQLYRQIIPRRRTGFHLSRGLNRVMGLAANAAREQGGEIPKKRGDGWMEIEMGEFFNDQGGDEVEMSLLEVNGGHWKAGLFIQGIELRPKESK